MYNENISQICNIKVIGVGGGGNNAVNRMVNANIKSAELKIIEDTSHVVNEENPKALAEILNEYYLQNP